jgi:hypothetical protein
LRIVRRIAAFLLIAGPIGGLIGVTQASAAYPSTTTVLSAVTASTTYGSETQTFTVTVTGDTGGSYGAPLGVVSVYGAAGATDLLCSTSTLVSLNGPPPTATEYQCSDSETALQAGNYTNVYAAFVAGDTNLADDPSSTENGVNYNNSDSSGAYQTIGVNPDPVTTSAISLAINPATVDVGAENVPGLFTVRVTGQANEGYPIGSGSVTLSDSACTPAFVSGLLDVSTWACAPTASFFAAGTYTGITATYTAPACTAATPSASSSNPDYCYSTVTSSGETLQVNTLETTTSALVVAPTTIVFGQETSVTFTDTVTGMSGDGYPEGPVYVTSGATALCNTSTITSHPAADASVFVCSPTSGSLLGVGPNQEIVATYTPGSPGTTSSMAGFDYSGSQGFGALTVTPAPPAVAVSITTTSLPSGTRGTPYSQTVFATGGTQPYTWSISSGAEPTGLAPINPATGVIAGTPTVDGVYTFTVEVTDSSTPVGHAFQTFTVTIGSGSLTIITGSSLPSAMHGRLYSATVSATGGFGAYHWSMNMSSAAGLVINPSTGVISGRAGATGTYHFTVTVVDSSVPALTTSKNFTIVIT